MKKKLLPRHFRVEGAPVVLASLRAPGALLRVLARPPPTPPWVEPGCARARVPTRRTVDATRWASPRAGGTSPLTGAWCWPSVS